jgi:hypothetical protein
VSPRRDFTDDVERAIERELGTAEAIVHVELA